MKTNEDLQHDVECAINERTLMNAGQIGVTAKDGIITLSGVVDCYAKKLAVESATKAIAGVKAVVENIDINFGAFRDKKDG